MRTIKDQRTKRALADAPETYYLTEYYHRHPVVLARLSRLDRDALHDLLSASRWLTLAKAGLACTARRG